MSHLPSTDPIQPLQRTGDAEIDAEHDAILVSLTALVHSAAMDVGDLLSARALLSSHFATEEATMGRLSDQRRQAHVDAHGHFLLTLDRLIDAVRAGEVAGGDRAYPLMLWFIVHSNTADVELAESHRQPVRLPDLVVMKDWLAAIGADDLADAPAS